jgi:CRP-like cAMP-binding protein
MSKLVLPGAKRRITAVDRIATVDSMMEDIYTILKDQIEKQRVKAIGATFNDKDMKTVEALTDSLVKLSREERERLRSDALQKQLEGLTDEELAALLQKR